MSKFYIKKGDTVYINTGDDKGKTGRVLKMIFDKKSVLVEGVNVVSKSVKPNSKYPKGGFIKKEMPIHVSNLSLLDPMNGTNTRIGRKLDDKGKIIRFSKKSKEIIK